MKRNFETTLLKILYVIIALTSFMLIRQYTYTNNYNNVDNTSNRAVYENYNQDDFLEGEEEFYYD